LDVHCRGMVAPKFPSRPNGPRFKLGQVVATPGALRALEEAAQQPVEFLARHQSHDWGEVCAADKNANDRALVEGTRLLSAYTLRTGVRVWLITEADRSSTTILLPDEY